MRSGRWRPVDFTVSQTYLSVIGTLPISSALSVFGRAGHNWIDDEGKGNGFKDTNTTRSCMFGIGLMYTITPALSARIEVQKPASDVTKTAAGIALAF